MLADQGFPRQQQMGALAGIERAVGEKGGVGGFDGGGHIGGCVGWCRGPDCVCSWVWRGETEVFFW